MQSAYKVAVLVGSLRKGSISRKVAHALEGLAPERLKLEIVEIGDLPHLQPGPGRECAARLGRIPTEDRGCGRRAVRDAGIQPLGPRRA